MTTHDERDAEREERGLPRWAEVALASGALWVAAPVVATCAVAVKLSSRGPVLFAQERVGRGFRSFRMYKLRSMRTDLAGAHVTRSHDPRITRVGRILRKYKLDEIPELWNVVRGDMALVGPRPEVPSFVDPEDPAWREVMRVRPGLTHPVTIALRNEEELIASSDLPAGEFYRERLLPWKLAAYARYEQRRSWWTDCVVLCQTVAAVVRPASVVAPDLSARTAS
ncbi:MAG: sugar transferase [Sandaracinus sp.]